MGVFEHRMIVELFAAARTLGLSESRAALVAGIPLELTASLPAAPTPADQLLVDLGGLNGMEGLSGGLIPIAVWLENALALKKAFSQATVFERALAALRGNAPASSARAHFFLSYRRQGEEAALAGRLHKALERLEHSVFIDVGMNVGTDWARKIQEHIETSDVFVVLISAESIGREMVLDEVRRAHRRARATGRPLIVPVRVCYDGPLDYELHARIGRLQFVRWDSRDDDANVIDCIERALRTWVVEAPADGEPRSLAPPAADNALPLPRIDPRFAQTGTLELDDPFYIQRRGDSKVLTMARAGNAQTLVINGPRQCGKSSLLVRYLAECQKLGKKVAYIDFQVFAGADFEIHSDFLTGFAQAVVDELEIETTVPAIRRQPEMTSFFQRQVLKAIDGPLVLALDDPDCIYTRSYRIDFFAMLRSWHNNRALRPAWKQLDLALVLSTPVHLLIDGNSQSPFNVGAVIALDSLTRKECHELDRVSPRHLAPAEFDELHQLLGGHPYLTRVAYHLLTDGMRFDELVRTATEPYGPFGDHLRALLSLLARDARLLPALQQIIQYGTVSDPMLAQRLHDVGLVYMEKGRHNPSNLLYAQFFKNVR